MESQTTDNLPSTESALDPCRSIVLCISVVTSGDRGCISIERSSVLCSKNLRLWNRESFEGTSLLRGSDVDRQTDVRRSCSSGEGLLSNRIQSIDRSLLIVPDIA